MLITEVDAEDAAHQLRRIFEKDPEFCTTCTKVKLNCGNAPPQWDAQPSLDLAEKNTKAEAL